MSENHRLSSNREVVARHVEALHALATSSNPPPKVQRVAAKAATQLGMSNGRDLLAKLADEVKERGLEAASGADHPERFYAGHPVTAGVQTALHRRYDPGLVDRFLQLLRIAPKSADDPRWIANITIEVLARLGGGCHRFNPRNATYDISDNARVILVGDWGTGLPRALDVAGQMSEKVAEALQEGRAAHVIHLGDVYFAGEKDEYRRNVLASGVWPVSAKAARSGLATSWALNGNHDMYSGARHYFSTMLGDDRFKLQRSPDGSPTSVFLLRSGGWNIVGLDTAWSPDIWSMGTTGVLENPQGAFVEGLVAQNDRRGTILLSHHQLMSHYEPERIGSQLGEKLKGVFERGQIEGWFWGHEHLCMGFESDERVAYPRCLGNGGIPTPYPTPPVTQSGGPKVLWEARSDPPAQEVGHQWQRNGFAVLDLSGNQVLVNYYDDLGHETSDRECISKGESLAASHI